MKELIVDNRVRLKEISFEDAESIFNTINTEREYLNEWLPFVELINDISHTQKLVQNYLESDRLDRMFSIYFNNQFAGFLGLKDTDIDHKRTEIGYWLSEKYQRQGIMTRSCKVLIDYIFTEMDINRIQLKVATENLRSQGIPNRLGFTLEGTERDGELHSRGFVDLLVFSLLKKDLKI